MAKCIRCGKPCASGENMCDECKAWFQEKTGGSVVPGVKKQIPPKKENKVEEKVNKPVSSEPQKEVQQEGSSGGTAEDVQDSRPISEAPTLSPRKGGNIVLSKKSLYMIIGGVIAVIVIVILIVALGGNKKSDVENYYGGTTDEAYQEDHDDWDNEDTYDEEYASDVDGAVPENVTRLWNKYEEQVDSYYHNDNLESAPVEDGYVYYLYGELIEVNNITVDDWGTDYYYDNGEVYFALNRNDAGEEDKLFYDSGSLIYWIDSDGNNHDASEAEEYWGYTVNDAEYLYYTYYDRSVIGFEETSEYILPNSDSEYISESDLYGLSEWEVRIARNEIMARHGRRFKDQSLQDYFDSCSWYYGSVSPDEFDKNYESNLNQYEKKNATTIKEYEKKQGYNQ